MKRFSTDNKQFLPSYSQEQLEMLLPQLIVDRDETFAKIANKLSKEEDWQWLEKKYIDICNEISAIETWLSTSKDNLVKRLSILTSHRDSIIKQISNNPKLEKELETTLKQISDIENALKEQNEHKENKSDSEGRAVLTLLEEKNKSESTSYDSSQLSNCRSSSSSSYSSNSSLSSSSAIYDSSQVSNCRSSSSSSLTSSFSSGFGLVEDKYPNKENKDNQLRMSSDLRNVNDQALNEKAIARLLLEDVNELEYKEKKVEASSIRRSLPDLPVSSSNTSSFKSLMESNPDNNIRAGHEKKNSEKPRASVLPSKTTHLGAGFFDIFPQKLSTSTVKQTSLTVESNPLPSAPINDEKRVLQLKSSLETETQEWEKIIGEFLTTTKCRDTKLFLNKFLREISRIQCIHVKTANSRADYEKASSCWGTTKSGILEQVKSRIEKNPDMQGLLQKLSNPIPIHHVTLNTQRQETLRF